MNRVFVTRRIPQAGIDLLTAAGAEVRIGQPDDEASVVHAILEEGTRWCDVLLSLLTEPIDSALLSGAAQLRGIANFAVGYNNIDIAAATAAGIPVSNTPGVLTESTADLTWALLLAAARRIPEAQNYMVGRRYKLWGPNLLLGSDVGPGAADTRKVLGVIGYGRIGVAVARRAQGFDMDVLAFDPYARKQIAADTHVRWAELDDLLARSDFVTLHTVLNDETRHLLNERTLRLMKRTAILINVARGAVVDERALVKALQEGWIAGAALDVYEHEPRMAPGLAECHNAVLVPHIASATVDTRNRMATMAAENALAHLAGVRAPNAVNPEVYGTDAYRARLRGAPR